MLKQHQGCRAKRYKPAATLVQRSMFVLKWVIFELPPTQHYFQYIHSIFIHECNISRQTPCAGLFWRCSNYVNRPFRSDVIGFKCENDCGFHEWNWSSSALHKHQIDNRASKGQFEYFCCTHTTIQYQFYEIYFIIFVYNNSIYNIF